MKIHKVEIKNFRSISSTAFTLDSQLTAVVGGNEGGKTNALLAIRMFLDQEVFEEMDKYQLATTEPEIMITFKDFTNFELEQLKSLFSLKAIEELTIVRTGNEYKIVAPSITTPEIISVQENSETGEVSATVPADDVNAHIAKEKAIFDKVFELTPLVEYISSVEHLVRGKNIPLADIVLTDEDLEKPENQEKRYIATIKSLLSLGNISNDDLKNSDTNARAFKLNKGASIAAEKLRSAWNQEDIKMRIFADSENLVIHFRDGKNISPAEPENDAKWIWTLPEGRSYGFRWFVTFYSLYLNKMSSSENHVFIVDDLGMFLNKKGQLDLLNKFKQITSENSNIQIIYVTHSRYMVEWDFKNQILMAHKEPGEGTKLDNEWWNKFETNELPPPLDELPLTWSEDILKEKNLVVEGPLDVFVIHKLIQVFDGDLVENPLGDYKVVPAGGAPKVAELGVFCKERDKISLLLFDSDQIALDVKNGTTVSGSNLSAKDLNELTDSQDFGIISIEDFLPRAMFIAELNAAGIIEFPGNWQNITSLRDISTLGLVESAKHRLESMGISNAEVKRFFFDYKSLIVSGILKTLTKDSYNENIQVEAIKNFYTNLKTSLT